MMEESGVANLLRYDFNELSNIISDENGVSNNTNTRVAYKKNISEVGRQTSSASTHETFKSCHDGERTRQLVHIAGVYFAKGNTLDEVINLTRGWNIKNSPPLKDEKIVTTCQSIQNTHQRNHGTALVPA